MSGVGCGPAPLPGGLTRRQLARLGAGGAAAAVLPACTPWARHPSDGPSAAPSVGLDSLSRLSLDTLRRREYPAQMQVEAATADGVMVSYRSDGLRLYARILLPRPPAVRPPAGWPVVVHAHGWVGEQGAPRYSFGAVGADPMGPVLQSMVQAGHVVVVPGFRGHGRVNGVPADGLAWIQAYDNGSYLAPLFYAVDLLHALQALGTLDQALPGLQVDRRRIHLTGHSQGGDVALTALAASTAANGPLAFAAASIWAGCFEGRIEQGRFYGAMEGSADALKDPRFLPVMPAWWKPSMYIGTIEQGQRLRQRQMYDTVRRWVRDQADAHPDTRPLDAAMAALDAFKHPQHLRVPLQLHCSDSDHYSPAAWNESLARRVQAAGGRASAHVYRGNTHGFGVEPGWSPPGAQAGLGLVTSRTLEWFR